MIKYLHIPNDDILTLFNNSLLYIICPFSSILKHKNLLLLKYINNEFSLSLSFINKGFILKNLSSF